VSTPQGVNKLNFYFMSTTTATTRTALDQVKISDYSDKAIVVTGETKPIKDVLRAMGGRFNFRLRGGAGWIFSKTKRATVEAKLSSLPATCEENNSGDAAHEAQAADNWAAANL
jgi:hypothetical protein